MRASIGISKRVRNRQGEGGRLRTDLIAAADRLLALTGDADGLSLRAVAREAGVATPSIYLHFPDKQALIQAVLAARFAELGASVRAAVMAATGPAEQLRAGCLAYCRFATEHPNAYRVLFGRQPTPPVPVAEGSPHPNPLPEREGASSAALTEGDGDIPASLSPQVGAAAFGFLIDGVSACMTADLAPDGDAVRVAVSVWTALHGIVSLRGSVPSFPWPPLQQQVDDVLGGLVGLRHNPLADNR